MRGFSVLGLEVMGKYLIDNIKIFTMKTRMFLSRSNGLGNVDGRKIREMAGKKEVIFSAIWHESFLK